MDSVSLGEGWGVVALHGGLPLDNKVTFRALLCYWGKECRELGVFCAIISNCGIVETEKSIDTKIVAVHSMELFCKRTISSLQYHFRGNMKDWRRF